MKGTSVMADSQGVGTDGQLSSVVMGGRRLLSVRGWDTRKGDSWVAWRPSAASMSFTPAKRCARSVIEGEPMSKFMLPSCDIIDSTAGSVIGCWTVWGTFCNMTGGCTGSGSGAGCGVATAAEISEDSDLRGQSSVSES